MSDAKLVRDALHQCLAEVNGEGYVIPSSLREACHAADRLCTVAERRDADRFIDLVDRLRERGAVYVRCGEMSAEFATQSKAQAMPAAMVLKRDEPARQMTAEEIADAEAQEYIP
jgi:hypothetical protein